MIRRRAQRLHTTMPQTSPATCQSCSHHLLEPHAVQKQHMCTLAPCQTDTFGNPSAGVSGERVSTLKANLMAKAMSMTAVASESSTRPLRPVLGLREGVLVPPGP